MNENTPASDSEPAPLDRLEIMALVGAALIVIGVFCPAISFGVPKSFFATGNTVAAMLLGLAGATGWSIAMRRPASVLWNGLLSVLIVTTFGVAVWNDDVREPVRTIFGTIQSQIRPTSWILIGIGAALVALAGYLARNSDSRSTNPLPPRQWLAIAGMVLVTLGCLFGIALTNPFGPISSGSLGEIGRSWDEQLNIVRWLLLTGSVFGVVLSTQVPRLADQALRILTGITWFLVGNALFILLSPMVSASLYLAVAWNITCFRLLLWKTNARRSWTRWQRLILWFPYLAFGVLLVVMGEFGDLIFAAAPPVAVVAIGYLFCRSSKWAVQAVFGGLLVLGIPAAMMAFGAVPNEYLEPCGLSSPEGRVMLLTFVGALAWASFLSFSTTPADTPMGKGDTTLRGPNELESNGDAAF